MNPPTHRSTPARGALRGRSRPHKGVPSSFEEPDAPRSRNAKRKTIADPYVPGRSASSKRRLAPSYDLEGPRIRLGLLWFALVCGALVLGRFASDMPLIGALYAVAAGIAALQVTDAWVSRPRSRVLRSTAAVIALGVGLSASFGARSLGAALLGAIAVALVAATSQATRHRNVLTSLGLILQASLPVGVVAASLTLTMRYEIGAAIILLAMVMAFDVGDFLIGSGAASVVEGPIAGAIMIALVGGTAAITGAPPFHGRLAWAFAAGAMVLCPLGQVFASWLLPDSSVRASALRRLDSLLLLAPVWAFTAGIVAAHT